MIYASSYSVKQPRWTPCELVRCAAQREGTGFARETRLRPPLPEEALDRLREYWNGIALSCGAASLRNRENWGSIPAPGERQPGSFGVAKRIDRSGRDLSAPFERRAAR